MATASVIGIQHSRASLRSIVDPHRSRCSSSPATVVRNRSGSSVSVLKAAYPSQERTVVVPIGDEADVKSKKPLSTAPRGKWVDVLTHLGVVYLKDTAKNQQIYAHRRSQHYCWSTLQRGGADALIRFIVYSVYLAIVLLAEFDNEWEFLVNADVHYMYWAKTCPGAAHECQYYPKHYRHRHKTNLLLFIGFIGWVYAGLSLDVEIFEVLYRKNVELVRRWLRICFTSVLLVIGHILNGQTDIISLMFIFTLTMAFFVQIESFKQNTQFSYLSTACSSNLERVFIAFIILLIWAYSLVPTIITWADDSSKTPELLWIVNFVFFFMLWFSEIVMLWSGKCRNEYTLAIARAIQENPISENPADNESELEELKKAIDALKSDNISGSYSQNSTTGVLCCKRKTSRKSPPFSQKVSFQIICQIIQDTIYVSYLTSILMYSV